MLDETKDVTTLDIQNTETELVEEPQEVDNGSSSQSEGTETPSGTEDTRTSDENNENEEKVDLESLTDEEFDEYLISGKIPEGKGQKNGTKSTRRESSESVQTRSESSRNENDGRGQNQNEKRSSDNNKQQNNERKDESASLQRVDYESVYKQIFKPFKANGKDIAPRTVEDVISLMQMGANYTKKMQAMAPLKKTVETLNKAEIKDEDLNFLIDLHKGDKEAIKQLVKKHNIDPIDLDLESINYKPTNHTVSDADVEFKINLEDIKESVPKIQDVLKTWDTQSKDRILGDTKLLYALHEEIQHGRFDEVQGRLELEKTFGRYKGKSDLDAYIDVMQKMVAEKSKQTSSQTPKKTTNTPKQSIPDKSKAAPTKSVPGTGRANITAKDIFDMSDEDFEKLSVKDLV